MKPREPKLTEAMPPGLLETLLTRLDGFIAEYQTNRTNTFKKLDELRAAISPAAPPHKLQDGPFVPDGFRLSGREYRGFSRLAWLLLQCLWGKEDGVLIDDVILHLYGGVDGKEGAVKSVHKRLNKELRRKNCPVLIESKTERLSLILPRPDRGSEMAHS